MARVCDPRTEIYSSMARGCVLRSSAAGKAVIRALFANDYSDFDGNDYDRFESMPKAKTRVNARPRPGKKAAPVTRLSKGLFSADDYSDYNYDYDHDYDFESIPKAKTKANARPRSRKQAAPATGKGDSCILQTTAKYTKRPGPPYPGNDPACWGQTKYGNDNELYQSVPNVNQVYSWKKVKF